MSPRQIAYAIHHFWNPRQESLEAFVERCWRQADQAEIVEALAICADQMVEADLAR